MPSLDYRVGYWIDEDRCPDALISLKAFTENDLAINLKAKIIPDNLSLDVLLIENQYLKKFQNLSQHPVYKRSLLAFHSNSESIEIESYNFLRPTRVFAISDLTEKMITDELTLVDFYRQKNDLTQLALEQQLADRYTKKNLLERIQKTNDELALQKQLIIDSQNRNTSLIKILFSISSETEISRIETVLNELLPKSTSATWIRIVPEALSSAIESDLKKESFNFYIKKKFSDYFIYFIIGNVEAFKKSEYEIFQNIADVLETILSKLKSIQEQQDLEKLISTAYNSTFYPVLIVDKDYTIIESNQAFSRFLAPQLKCYEAMFNRNAPCAGCQLGQSFPLHVQSDKENVYFNVQSQKLRSSDDVNSQWFHFYSNVTEEKLLEQRLTQTVKMKELGLVSSSIAHELNNPLGGIISYIQILQMELDKSHTLQRDLADMAAAAQRMKNIIENLLVFSRRPTFDETAATSIPALVQEAIKLNELQFRIENFKIVQPLEPVIGFQVQLSPTAFRDSVNLIFNFFIDGLKRVRLSKPNLAGLIEVKFSQDQINFYLSFESNIGPLASDQKSKNIYFLIIHKSLIDQGFQIELIEPNPSWVALKVIIPKQDF